MIVNVRQVGCLLVSLSALGCGLEDQEHSQATPTSSRRAARNSGQLAARSSENKGDTKPGNGNSTAKGGGLGSDNKITGTLPWTTGRVVNPAPKVTEQTTRVWGKAMSAGGGTLTVDVPNGGARHFRTDENTFIGRAGDKHFHPYPGGLEGIQPGVGVSVQFYAKNGQEYASWIAVGAQPFAQKEAPTTKTE